MTNKEKYREFCKTEKNLIIFSKDWWLDAVCGEDNWDVVLVEKGGEIVASLPYFRTAHYIFKFLGIPTATQNLGPYIKYQQNQNYYSRFSWENGLISELLSKLPAYTVFEQRLPYRITNPLPFIWAGFNLSVDCTYIIEEVNMSTVMNNMQGNTLRDIKKAQKAGVKIVQSNRYDKLYELIAATFIRKNMRTGYTPENIERIFKAVSTHDACRLNFASFEGKFIAASLLVYDAQSVYYLMGGIDPEYQKLGAMSLLIKEDINFALSIKKIFDFEGGGNTATNRFFRSFGSIQKPYYIAKKINSKLYKTLKFIKGLY